MTNSFTNTAKIARVTNVTKLGLEREELGLEREEIKEGPEMSANIAKVTKIFLAT